jgi:hypothetical protein
LVPPFLWKKGWKRKDKEGRKNGGGRKETMRGWKGGEKERRKEGKKGQRPEDQKGGKKVRHRKTKTKKEAMKEMMKEIMTEGFTCPVAVRSCSPHCSSRGGFKKKVKGLDMIKDGGKFGCYNDM